MQSSSSFMKARQGAGVAALISACFFFFFRNGVSPGSSV